MYELEVTLRSSIFSCYNIVRKDNLLRKKQERKWSKLFTLHSTFNLSLDIGMTVTFKGGDDGTAKNKDQICKIFQETVLHDVLFMIDTTNYLLWLLMVDVHKSTIIFKEKRLILIVFETKNLNQTQKTVTYFDALKKLRNNDFISCIWICEIYFY